MSPESATDQAVGGSIVPLQQDAIDRRILLQQLDILARQGMRTTFPIVAVVAGIAFLAWNYLDPRIITLWAALTVGLSVVRALICTRVVRRGVDAAEAPRWARRFLAFAVVSGAAAGSVAVITFPHLPGDRLAVITMMICCWGVASVTSSGPLPRLVIAYAAPIFALTLAGWLMAGPSEAPLVALLLALFFALLATFASETGRVIERSIRLQYANEELLQQKENLLDLMRSAFDKAEAARTKAEEANRSKSQFLASASHDLRQPLHALSLLTAVLNDMTEDAGVREVGRHIGVSVQSLDGLFGALLDLSKLDAGAVTPELRTIPLHELLDRLSAEYEPKAQNKGLAYESRSEPVWIRTDPILLERVVRNLLENAIRFTQTGKVAISAERVPDGVSVRISDSGIGIPESEHARIFEEFYQIGNPARDRSQGLGLGLSIVQRLSRLLGLRVTLHSEAGRGATFALIVPNEQLSTAPNALGSEPARPGVESLAGIVVLIIDDDAEVRNAMNLSLKSWSCTPLVAASLEHARELLDATRLRPDAVICDLRLGNGASGIEAIEALQKVLGPIPAALVTGDTGADKLSEVRTSGLAVLHKPVKPADLRAFVRGLARPTAVI